MDPKTKRRMAASLLVVLAAVLAVFPRDLCVSGAERLGKLIFGSKSDAGDTLYAIVFDAGSTGSRIHIFFYKRKDDVIEIESEIYREVKPGLSSYSDDPQKGAESLLPLLELAVETIPSCLHASTPLTLKATAGLRLLQPQQATSLLSEVKKVFKRTSFLTQEDSIEIMPGVDEGIFSWVSLNYLLGDLGGRGPKAAALDLGGGSTQVTFLPALQETFDETPSEYFFNLKLLSKDFSLYTYSYLGNGLKAARYQMMDTKDNDKLSSVCLPPGHHFTWVYDGTPYKTRGNDAGITSFEHCHALAREFVSSSIRRIPELQNLPLFAFAYFYDTAEEVRLINGTGGPVEVSSFRKIAEEACGNHDVRWPFVCMDNTYIYSLLHDGYGLADSAMVQVLNRIKGFDVSWPLGLALQLLSVQSH